MNWKSMVRIDRSHGWDRFEIRLGRVDDNGYTTVAKPVVMVRQDKGKEIIPAMALESHECQMLMDELYSVGFRPTETRSNPVALKATENHLADMQKIAFILLDRK